MTKSEVTELVAILMSCYPNARFPDGTVVAYEMFLGELEHERAKQAVANLVRTSKFMPTIAEIMAAYGAGKEPVQAPYHRLFLPRPEPSNVMAPGELKSAIDEFLAGKGPS